MPDMLQWGSEWFHNMRNDHVASTIVYKPFQLDPIELDATLGRHNHRMADAAGASIAVEVWDFIVKRSDLSGHQPRQGERLVVVTGEVVTPIDFEALWDDTTLYHYEVMQKAGMPPFRDHDRFKDSIVIHAEQCETF